MINLREHERAKYEHMWTVDVYRHISPGVSNLPLFLDMSRTTMRGSVLDAGCGAGSGALALQAAGFDVTACDLTNAGLSPEFHESGIEFHTACLWDDLARVVGFKDWVYCCDVLEHVPAPFAMLVVHQLLRVARRGVFLSISFIPDIYGVFVGEPLHQTLQSFVAWRDQLNVVGRVRECRDLLNDGVFLVEPKS